jgi:hypothetical protein
MRQNSFSPATILIINNLVTSGNRYYSAGHLPSGDIFRPVISFFRRICDKKQLPGPLLQLSGSCEVTFYLRLFPVCNSSLYK